MLFELVFGAPPALKGWLFLILSDFGITSKSSSSAKNQVYVTTRFSSKLLFNLALKKCASKNEFVLNLCSDDIYIKAFTHSFTSQFVMLYCCLNKHSLLFELVFGAPPALKGWLFLILSDFGITSKSSSSAKNQIYVTTRFPSKLLFNLALKKCANKNESVLNLCSDDIYIKVFTHSFTSQFVMLHCWFNKHSLLFELVFGTLLIWKDSFSNSKRLWDNL